ncbi:hypothetical protein MA6G0125S_0413 [Mycobacteroides abscessus 6G-0125-S]|nr:hypothetical protein MA6G0125S_0413 [Mycobacteroides abscessus 6G-0125-S]ETZ93972.1 hypothetical protein L828_3221 [Mycobacteroides abscessus MAB_030201_1061]
MPSTAGLPVGTHRRRGVPGHTSPVTRSEAFAFTAAKNP